MSSSSDFSFASIRPPALGDLLGGCLLEGDLGGAGALRSFAGVHQGTGRAVRVHVHTVGLSPAERQAYLAFRNQAQLLARFRHPFSARAAEAGDGAGFSFVAVERPAGTTAAELVAKGGPLRRFKIARMLGPVVEALDAAAAGGLFHRALSPETLVIGADGGSVLAGWGLYGPHAPTPGLTDAAYMAPELASGAAASDASADIYSLGAVLYFLLTGRPPFTGATRDELIVRHQRSPLTPASQANPAVDAATSDLISRMMAKDPRSRPAGYESVIAALGLPRSHRREGHFAPGGPAAAAAAPVSAPAARPATGTFPASRGWSSDALTSPAATSASAASAATALPADPYSSTPLGGSPAAAATESFGGDSSLPTIDASAPGASPTAPTAAAPKKKKVMYFRGQRIERDE